LFAMPAHEQLRLLPVGIELGHQSSPADGSAERNFGARSSSSDVFPDVRLSASAAPEPQPL
jgi:hypothetical protein